MAQVTRTCEYCNAIFTVPLCRLLTGGGKYCSVACGHLARRGADGIELDGRWFCRDRRSGYYWAKNPNTSLHRYIWVKHNGAVPEGFVVHHKDGNKRNNTMENLELITPSAHSLHHSEKLMKEDAGAVREHLARANKLGRAWHQSEEGRAWHRANGERIKELWADRHKAELSCLQCGRLYLGHAHLTRKGFCSPTCKTKHRRLSGIDNIIRQCSECGKDFSTCKRKKVKTCSEACRVSAIARTKRRYHNDGMLSPRHTGGQHE